MGTCETGMFLYSDWSCVWGWMGRNSSNVIAFAALIISGCALVTSLWQAGIARRHNYLSVKPMLEPTIDRQLAQVAVDLTTLIFRGHIVMRVRNVGLGTAIITRFKVFIDGKDIPVNDMKSLERAIVAVVGLPPRQINQLQTFTFQHRTGLPKDSAIVFLMLEMDIGTEPEFHALDRRVRESIRLVFDYESVYGEKQTIDTDEYGPLPEES